MVDPLSSFFRSQVTQQTLSTGLQSLLQSGTQKGTIQQNQAGKLVVNIKGQQIPLTNQQQNLQPGQQVNIKLQNSQLLIEPLLQSSTSSTQTQTETSRTITAILSQLGIQGPQAAVVTQALLHAYIPLDKSVVQELVQLLPQLNPESMQAMIFLISRRLPISDSMLYWFTRIFSRRENIGKLTQAVLQDIEGLKSDVEQESNDALHPIRSGLGDFQEDLQQQFQSFQDASPEEIAEETKEAIQAALTSAEAMLLGYAKSGTTLSETMVRLLAFLLDMQQKFETSSFSTKLQELIYKVEVLQEQLTSQTLQTIPDHDEVSFPGLFIRIPVWKDHEADDMEFLYRKGSDDGKSGSMDVKIELSNLGAINIHVGWQNPKLNIGFDVERSDVQEFLSGNIDELKSGLQAAGFQVDSLHVKQTQVPDTIQPQMPNPLHAALSGIDVRG